MTALLSGMTSAQTPSRTHHHHAGKTSHFEVVVDSHAVLRNNTKQPMGPALRQGPVRNSQMTLTRLKSGPPTTVLTQPPPTSQPAVYQVTYPRLTAYVTAGWLALRAHPHTRMCPFTAGCPPHVLTWKRSDLFYVNSSVLPSPQAGYVRTCRSDPWPLLCPSYLLSPQGCPPVHPHSHRPGLCVPLVSGFRMRRHQGAGQRGTEPARHLLNTGT